MMTLINRADHKLLIGASARIVPFGYGETMRICELLHRQHRRRWHGRDTNGPDELVTKARPWNG
jgi:hypothetical protein